VTPTAARRSSAPLDPHRLRCVLAIKRTALAAGGRPATVARRGDASGRRLLAADDEHRRTLATVRESLRARSVDFIEIVPDCATPRELSRLGTADLVISIGGDGTFLAVSHHVSTGAILGVNSAPRDSVGHFCAARRSDVGHCLDTILAGRLQPARLLRLQLELDGRRVPSPVLNDLLIVHSCAASTTRYRLRVGTRSEEHRSSGIWISTPAGSSAGIRSAGGRLMPAGSRRFQYRVRELYREPGRSYRLAAGFLDGDAAFVVTSAMSEGRIFVDGSRSEIAFPFGAVARVTRSPDDLRLFVPRSWGTS
jgi:NAD+ kinase